VELGAHDVVVVTGEDADAGAALPVPHADRLVVRGAQHPRVLVVEEGGAHIVQVSHQREQALALLVVPHLVHLFVSFALGKLFCVFVYLDFVVVAARDEQRLFVVEVNSSDGAFVLVELLQQSAHSVVP
jgi:hypothetical protein